MFCLCLLQRSFPGRLQIHVDVHVEPLRSSQALNDLGSFSEPPVEFEDGKIQERQEYRSAIVGTPRQRWKPDVSPVRSDL